MKVRASANDGQMWHHDRRNGREQKNIRDIYCCFIFVVTPNMIS